MTSYLSTQEVADRLGVSVFTIRRYIRTGKLRAVKLDGLYRLSHDDVKEFLQTREIYLGPVPTGSGPHSPPAPDPAGPGS
ncbi:hypothetical protein DCC79_09305 [bacterium]|nr:DNA-binding protein [Chloroflexi bacterium CFX6]RIL10006.1 MAG: hypothetical protein DCC79_09305 [bacterium]